MNSYKRKKRVVEIYFLLYLAALILLLPNKDTQRKSNNENPNFQTFEIPFQLQSEKTALTCKLKKTKLGSEIISMDSVNQIFWRGDLSEIQFEFIVEDLSQRLKVSLSKNNSNSKYFKIYENSNEQVASFVWRPNTSELLNKTYLVKVIAKGISKYNNKVITLKSQFSLNIYYEDETPNFNGTDIAISNSRNEILNANNQNQIKGFSSPQIIQNNIELRPENFELKTVAYTNWNNFILVNGLNPRFDLLRNPIVTFQSESGANGSAKIVESKDNGISITGISPSFGSMKVKLEIISKIDKKSYSTEFIVKPAPISQPIYDRVMYPFKSYKIVPNLPLLANQKSKAIIKEGNSIRANSIGNNDLIFAPNITDTGKTFYLERYIDNEFFDQKYSIQVKSYPNPVIISTDKDSKNENLIIVKTKSYGFHNGKKNDIISLIVSDNRINQRELYGKYKDEGDIYYQTFELNVSK
ncbi:MAG: hypothetical protein NTW25_11380, partial [Candidatus Kapabacteria bacterium]|nr:hypothetical protein [Candidatus Kapabacteria bacterium]